MFWNSRKTMKEIHKSLQAQKKAINSLDKYVSNGERNRVEWCTVHQRECRSTGLLMWEKDLEHRYTFINTRHCNDFFHTSLADVKQLIGKTDTELIKDFVKRTGLDNTFGEMCTATDIYTLKQNKVCRFWEMGYIGDDIFILDITKKPLIKDNKVTGTQSWALNKSANECEIKALLELFLNTGEAIRLNKYNSKRIASYLITKNINPFNGVFPA